MRLDSRLDCDSASAAASSIGAMHLVEGKCLMCMNGSWKELDPPSCGVPHVEALRVPTLAPEQSDGPYAVTVLGAKLVYFISDEGFANAQALIDSTARSKERTTDGLWVGALLFAGYQAELVPRTPGIGGHWDDQLALLRQWRAVDPKSGAAALMEASYWAAYAWFARGGQFFSNVPDEAYKTAQERMARARAILEEAKPYSASNPAWYAQMLDIATFQGWPAAERLAIFDEAVKLEPLYDWTYFAMAHSLTPRWGGSLTDYHRFVTAAVKKTKSDYGNLLYARLYWRLSNVEKDKDPFKELQIPWPRMKSGFDDLMKHYPNSQWNLQHYAYFACIAGDGKTFNSLLPQLVNKLPNSTGSPWRAPYTRDYCATRFAKVDSRH